MSKMNNSYKRDYKRQRFVFVIMLMMLAIFSTGLLVKAHWEQPVITVFLEDSDNAIPKLVKNVHQQSRTYEKPYYTAIKYINDDSLYIGEYKVVQEAEAGNQRIFMLDTYINGELKSSKKLDREIVQKAIPKVVHIGTRSKPDYIYPVTSYVFTSGFGPRWGTNHNGVDLAVPTGTKVMAAADGKVIQSGWNGGYGISVYIDHGNGMVTRYGHMSQANCKVGDFVSQGEVIGLSGSTGNSTGPHVHFEMRMNEIPVNPVNYASED